MKTIKGQINCINNQYIPDESIIQIEIQFQKNVFMDKVSEVNSPKVIRKIYIAPSNFPINYEIEYDESIIPDETTVFIRAMIFKNNCETFVNGYDDFIGRNGKFRHHLDIYLKPAMTEC